MKNFIITSFLLFGAFFVFLSSNAQRLTITANHADAKFHLLNDLNDSEITQLGAGTVEYKLDKNLRNRIKVSKPGYQTVIKEFNKDFKWDRSQQIVLDVRQVEISKEPFDAEVFLDGVNMGASVQYINIPLNQSATIEVKKAGFVSVTKVYHNSPNREVPPIRDIFELKTRQVRVEVSPADCAVLANGTEMGRGNQDVSIPLGECVTVTVTKEGYVEYTQVYCNKPGIDPDPALRDAVTLKDRMVRLATVPNDANIEIQGQRMGSGSYDLVVPAEECVRVYFKRDGFISYYKDYCNKTGRNAPPVQEMIEMARDQAYDNSISSDIANVRITMPINTNYTNEESWRILSSIVTRYFDILETVDFNTGYLTTAWQVENFNSSIIRTRVIISSGGNSDQLAYSVKLVSQVADMNDPNRTKEVITVKDDEYFKDWSRILMKYRGLIEELQARLQ